MFAGGRHRWPGALALLAVAGPLVAAPIDKPARPAPPPRTADAIRADALAAERLGDWEAAFTAYCRLYLADRAAADVRDRLNAALRRAQQARRHRDPAFQQFAAGLTPADALTLYAEVVSRVSAVAADRDRAAPQKLWAGGVEEFDRALGSPAFRRQFLADPPADKVEAFRAGLRTFWAKRPVANARDARGHLRQLVAAAADTFPVPHPAAVAVEFVCGACAGLDEYTVYLAPVPAAADPTADLAAYGVYLAFQEGGLFVDGVVPNSWAALHTGIRRGDRVIRVNGRPTDGATAAALADALRAPLNGAHEVEIALPVPDMGGTFQFPLTLPTVYGDRMLPARGVPGVGYVRVGSFRDTTADELDAAVLRLKSLGMRALVLDLRGNHGGLFAAGVAVSQRFLPGGIIVTTQGQVGEYASRVYSSDSGMAALDVPLALLIDAETASAAEVVAGALKDNGRATLVGLPSFGKGAVQFPVKLMSLDDLDEAGRPRVRSGSVKVTIARLYSPRGVPINGQGVSPHVVEADAQRQLELAVDRLLDLLPTAPRAPAP